MQRKIGYTHLIKMIQNYRVKKVTQDYDLNIVDDFRKIIQWVRYLNDCCWDFPSGSVVKNLPSNLGDLGLVPGLGRSGEGKGNPL